jgi:hypothetical protein
VGEILSSVVVFRISVFSLEKDTLLARYVCDVDTTLLQTSIGWLHCLGFMILGFECSSSCLT